MASGKMQRPAPLGVVPAAILRLTVVGPLRNSPSLALHRLGRGWLGNKISQPEMQAPVSAVLSVVSDALRASIESSQRNFGDGGVRLVYEDAAAAVLAALAAVPISGLVEALLDHAVVERE